MKGSDFINASYIELPNGRKKYIAAQGIGNSLNNFVLIFFFLFLAPTSNTLYDFLRMICEKNIKKILMLVNFNEDNKVIFIFIS
jgi:protein tyrosine phosphatase